MISPLRCCKLVLKRMKLLDLFCCAGGASMGYSQAGFEVTGVDIKDQPSYPFKFIKGDVMEIIKDKDFLNSFDVIHASPPCQGYSNATKPDSIYVHYSQGKDTPKLIEPVRNALINTGKYYIIENVAGAKEYLIEPFRLTGYMFNMPIERTRYFECNFPVAELKNITKRGYSKKYAEENGIDYRDMSVTGKSRRKGSIDVWRKVMDMPWAGRGRWEAYGGLKPPCLFGRTPFSLRILGGFCSDGGDEGNIGDGWWRKLCGRFSYRGRDGLLSGAWRRGKDVSRIQAIVEGENARALRVGMLDEERWFGISNVTTFRFCTTHGHNICDAVRVKPYPTVSS